MATPTLCTSGSLDELNYELKNCEMCPRHRTRKSPIEGSGNRRAEIVFVLDKFSEYEMRDLRVLSGPVAHLLATVIDSATSGNKGLADYWFTPAVSCPKEGGKDPAISELSACRPRLHREIHLIQPELVVGLGTVAVKSIFAKTPPSILSSAGRVKEARIAGDHTGYDIPVMVTYSPLMLLRNYDDAPGGTWSRFFEHVSRAVTVAETLRKFGANKEFFDE